MTRIHQSVLPGTAIKKKKPLLLHSRHLTPYRIIHTPRFTVQLQSTCRVLLQRLYTSPRWWNELLCFLSDINEENTSCSHHVLSVLLVLITFCVWHLIITKHQTKYRDCIKQIQTQCRILYHMLVCDYFVNEYNFAQFQGGVFFPSYTEVSVLCEPSLHHCVYFCGIFLPYFCINIPQIHKNMLLFNRLGNDL